MSPVKKNRLLGFPEPHEYDIKYASMSRFCNLLLITNVTVFVASGLVRGFQYYFPLIAIILLISVSLMLSFPWIRLRDPRVFSGLFITVIIGAYFTISSLIYMIQHGDFQRLAH